MRPSITVSTIPARIIFPVKSPQIANEVISRLLAASDVVRRRLAEHFLQHGLTEPRVNLLRTLAVHGETGCSQVELASAVGASESSLCGLIERMRLDGLLFRFRARQDRRKSIVVLSKDGSRLLAELEADCQTRLPHWVRHLSEEQCRELLSLLDRLSSGCDDGGIQAAPTLHTAGPESLSWKEAG